MRTDSVKAPGPSLRQFALVAVALWLAVAAWPDIPFRASADLDSNWVWAMNIAHTQGLVHGRDIVWTYGPLSYLTLPVAGLAGMYPVLLYRIGVYLIWCAAVFRLAFLPARIRYWVVPFLAFVAVFDPLICGNQLPIALFTWSLLVLMDSSKCRTVGLFVITVLSAVAYLIKTNVGVGASCVFATVLIGLFLQDRRLFRKMQWQIGTSLLLLPVLVMVLYTVETGSLASFPAYIRYSLDVAAGYSEAMSLPGSYPQALTAVASVAILFVVLPLVGGAFRDLAPGYLPALVYVFVAFKYAMVRQDAHAADFQVQIALAALFLLIVAGNKRFIWLTVGFQVACLLYTYRANGELWPYLTHFLTSRLSIVGNAPVFRGFVHWPQTWADLARESRLSLAPLHASVELQSLVGKKSVEAIPWAVVLAQENGWTWRPRPIFQTYSAYTPALDRLNAEYLLSSRAADLTMVSWTMIDGRHPFLDTPFSWRSQLDRYKPVGMDLGFLVLERRATSRFQSVEPVSAETTTWNQLNRVPQSTDPILLSAHIGKSFIGNLRTLLFRLSPLFIEVTRQSGNVEHYRAVRATFADGVIMNELAQNLGDLGVLATPGCSVSDPVVSFRFQTSRPGEFNSDIRLEWSKVVSRPEAAGNCVQIATRTSNIPVWGGTEGVFVSAGAGSSWSASTKEPWVAVETKGPQTGNTAVWYSVPKNSGSEPRQASLEIGGRIHTIVQLGPKATVANRATIQLGFYGQDFFPAETFPQLGADVELAIGRFNRLALEGQPVIGDWTGDGMMRVGVFHNGSWYLDLNGNQRWDGSEGGDGVFSFGMPGDIPAPGDWAGDGKTRLGVFRRGQWILDTNGNMMWDSRADRIIQFGLPEDMPVVAKWSHDHADRVGIFRRGKWIVDSNGDGAYQASDMQFEFGSSGDTPLISFGNGNIGVYRKGVCILGPKDARGFDAKAVLRVPCNAAPLIAGW